MPAQNWRSFMQTVLLRAWTRRGLLSSLLWPISLMYRSVVALRRQLYRWQLLKTHRLSCPVIVVGNVVAGGAGKTPTTIALAHHFKAHGKRVGIISRGYGRKSLECLEVDAQSDPRDVGDEPAMVQRATAVPVFVGASRLEAGSLLLQHYPQTDIILCDDGLQHYGLYRDLEICVFDNRGTGNGSLLPSGPLREPWPRNGVAEAGQSDERLLVLHTGDQPAFSGYIASRHLASHARRNDGSATALSDIQRITPRPLMALAGIAQPHQFFKLLEESGVHPEKTHGLPDHYDFSSMSRSVYGGYQLICTEKDAAKLWQVFPDALAVPLEQTIEPAFFDAVDARLHAVAQAKVSFPHGHKTA